VQVPDLVSDHIHNQEFEEVLNRCRSSVRPPSLSLARELDRVAPAPPWPTEARRARCRALPCCRAASGGSMARSLPRPALCPAPLPACSRTH
jgi:hypothetical protein